MAKIALLVEKIYDDLELQYPRLRLKEAGHTVEIIGSRASEMFLGKWAADISIWRSPNET